MRSGSVSEGRGHDSVNMTLTENQSEECLPVMDLGAPISALESALGDDETRGHHISLLSRCRQLGPPDEAKRAAADRPSCGQWRWHEHCPPSLLETQGHYARFF